MINVNILLDKVQPIINKCIELGYINNLKSEWLSEDLEKLLTDKNSSDATIFNNESSIRIDLNNNLYMSMDVKIYNINKNSIAKLTDILNMIETFNQEIKEIK